MLSMGQPAARVQEEAPVGPSLPQETFCVLASAALKEQASVKE